MRIHLRLQTGLSERPMRANYWPGRRAGIKSETAHSTPYTFRIAHGHAWELRQNGKACKGGRHGVHQVHFCPSTVLPYGSLVATTERPRTE
eukprot:5591086-Prymnesium_polylepis.1